MFVLGIAVTYFLGTRVNSLLPDLERVLDYLPAEADAERFRQLVLKATPHEGETLGILERLLFFATFWVGGYGFVLAGAWLAFKVASKWESWQHIDKETLIPNDPLAETTFRHAWFTHLLMRFQIGSIANILCAVAGMLVGRFFEAAIRGS
jgi:hypothetical protein